MLAMKINDHNVSGTPVPAQNLKPEQTNGAGAAGRGGLGAKPTGSRSDQVALSGLFGRISRSIVVGEGSRAAYVSRISQAVSSGDYHPDSRAISARLIDDTIQRPVGG
jgi:hypothetical protein